MLMIEPGNEERRDLAHTAADEILTGLLDHRQPANPRADRHPHPLRRHLRTLEPGIAYGLDAGRHAVMDEDIHPPRILQRQVLADVEATDLAGDLHRKGGCIEAGNPVDSRTACHHILPSFGNGIPDWRDDPEASNDDSATCHLELRRSGHAATGRSRLPITPRQTWPHHRPVCTGAGQTLTLTSCERSRSRWPAARS
jgi:hypothetical protein